MKSWQETFLDTNYRTARWYSELGFCSCVVKGGRREEGSERERCLCLDNTALFCYGLFHAELSPEKYRRELRSVCGGGRGRTLPTDSKSRLE